MDLVAVLRKHGLSDREIIEGKRHAIYATTLDALPTALVLDRAVSADEVKAAGSVERAVRARVLTLAKAAGVKNLDGLKSSALLAIVVDAAVPTIAIEKPKPADPKTADDALAADASAEIPK